MWPKLWSTVGVFIPSLNGQLFTHILPLDRSCSAMAVCAPPPAIPMSPRPPSPRPAARWIRCPPLHTPDRRCLMSKPVLEVAEVVRRCGGAFLNAYGATLSLAQRTRLHALVLCRPSPLAGHLQRGDNP